MGPQAKQQDQLPAKVAPTFEAVYEAQFDYVFRSFRRLGTPSAEVDDLLQELFLIVHRRLPEFDWQRPLRPWLFGIAYRIAIAHRRRFRFFSTAQACDLADDGPNAEVQLDDQDRRKLLLEALSALDLEHRAVLVMHDVDEQAAPMVAEALGIPLNTVYSRLRTARAKLGARIRRLRNIRGES